MIPDKVQACQVPKVYALSPNQEILLLPILCFYTFLLHTKIKQEEESSTPRKADPFHSVNCQLLKPYSAHTTVS